MKLSYDQSTDSLYIHLSATPSVDSDEISEGVVLDYAADRQLVGIDVQHASRIVDMGQLQVSHLPVREMLAA